MSSFVSFTEPLQSCSLSIQDIKRLYIQFQNAVTEAGNSEITRFTKSDNQTEEEFENFKANVLSAYILTVVIRGTHGEVLVERNEQIFESPNLPEIITNIYFDSFAVHKAQFNIMPPQWLTLNIDFSSPPVLDWKNAVSDPTPNYSNITIEGNSDTWTHGVKSKLDKIVENRATHFGFLHKSFIYDIGLWFLGMPIAFWFTYKISPNIIGKLQIENGFLLFALNFYLFFLGLFIYRFLFGYTKWVFPKLSLKENKRGSAMHKIFWGAVIASIFLSFVYDIIKFILLPT